MQVSRSPIALWISAAATDESTPPDRPQITRPRGRPGRGCAPPPPRRTTPSTSRRQAGDPEQEVAEQLGAARRVDHLGVELHAVDRRTGFANAAIGQLSLSARWTKPGGSDST
jgi:hypothetical protein